ncbi:CHAT domain-containing protein [Bradyrhizobium ontarionense]|uniref:CHAT domain-containing protein n=1 Tax=Bradyrhizobium ontarionense TaxID=2898149 RepID=A0ABY3R6M6_9BRAD|nr:CHAT domain-containing tetratricopeptide repeat protein [Bradyrhizobium sp. A19]UFZ02550.1 CHAT domain-containing protein [Bradyrhizobium sp. A19]
MRICKRVAIAVWTSLIASGLLQPCLAKTDLTAESGRIIALSSAGKYREALPLAQAMVASLEATSNKRELAAALTNLGQVQASLGRDAEAEPISKRALALYEAALGLDSVEIAPALNNLAALYQRQQRYAEAEPLFKRALSIREKAFGAGHPDVGQALNNLATLYERQDRHGDAEPLFKRALAIYRKAVGNESAPAATLLNNLGQLTKSDGRLAEAEPLIRQSLAIRETLLGADHPDVARSLNNLADLKQRQQRYDDAAPLFVRALSIREHALGPDHPDTVAALNNLAGLYQAAGRNSDALPLVDRTVQRGQAQPKVALPVLFAAGRDGSLPAGKAFDGAIDVLQRSAQSQAASAVDKLAVRLAAGNDRLAELVRRDQDLAAESETLDKAIIAAVTRPARQRDLAAEKRDKARVAAVAAERVGLRAALAREFPDFAALSNPLPLNLSEIQPLLADGEALVAFAVLDHSCFVLAITRDGFDWQQIPRGAAALARDVVRFRRGLAPGAVTEGAARSDLFDLAVASELYTTLLAPVEALTKDKRSLLIVPAAALTALPFHLLVTEPPAQAVPDAVTGYRDAAWLLRRQAVSVLPSLGSLKALRGTARGDRGGKAMVGFGDPVFDPTRTGAPPTGAAKQAARNIATLAYTDFWRGAGVDRAQLARALPQLPDTADELNAIAGDLGVAPSDVHLGIDASETTVKRAPLTDYRIVYFATHGLVAGDVKGIAEPSLALSLPAVPSALDDGLLTASEVAQLKLNADFVVLSACNTIAGDRPGAEALSGLARAFFYAGARALLVTHWAVDSAAATRLMTDTFHRLKDSPTIGRSEALRRAMLAVLDDRSSPASAYPSVWAAFLLLGETEVR